MAVETAVDGAAAEDTAGGSVLPVHRRQRQTSRRPHVVKVRLSDQERDEVLAGAAALGLTPAGFVAESALAAARGSSAPAGSSLRTLQEVGVAMSMGVTQLRKAGVNLNQVVAELHSTGQVPAALEAVVARVERTRQLVQTLAEDVQRQMRRGIRS